MKLKQLHILIIIIGIIFITSGIFHTNLWFDEAYSVGMANHNFTEIWTIGGNDVHPVLYYWILRIIALLTNSSIIAYRAVSAIAIAILGVLGYTHIRKDFGEKTGIIFSFLTYCLPAIPIYANEIRMYSISMLFITILAIYAYRLIKTSNIKNWVIFGIFSLCSIYIHYYGLMCAGIINIILLIYLIKNKRKKDITIILILGVIQAVSYIPWIMYFASQLNHISHGFWIGFTFPDTLIELVSCQFAGNLNKYVGLTASILIYSYCIFLITKTEEEKKPAVLAISIYLSVIVSAIIMTAILKTSIVYYRYLFVITGLYIFAISFALAKQKNKYITIMVCSIILIMGSISNYKMLKENYSLSNIKYIGYLEKNIKTEDIIVYDKIGLGSMIAINFRNNEQYFYNKENWGVEEAYKAFAPQMETYIDLSFLEDYKGRIWLIDSEDYELYNLVFNNERYTKISEEKFRTKYKNNTYNIILVETK